jgi:predicted SnoaL-like aldol condensation-catalyzing enzyme
MPDYAAIAELFARYGAANDLHSRELLASTLTEDATATITIAGVDDPIGPLNGRDTIVSFFGDILDSQTDQRRHLVTNIRRLEGDRVNAYLTLIVTDAGETVVKSAGVYEATVAEEDGELKLSSFVLSLDRAF